MTRSDPVRPEDVAYVKARDRGCLVGILDLAGEIGARDPGPCRRGDGKVYVSPHEIPAVELTIAHVRDRGRGGRMSKRPPSVPRHLAAVCYGHHLADPIIDRPDVRDAADAYLAFLEGPEPEPARPWERIARIRGREEGTP